MFKVTEPIENCLLFEFDKQKDMTLCFCRMQEYYESDLPKLNGKYFSFYEFINECMKDNGEITYFGFWEGFNLPGKVYEKWRSRIGELTDHEIKLDKAIREHTKKGFPYYIIGVKKGHANVIDHELAHAMYSLKKQAQDLSKKNSTYVREMVKLNEEFETTYPQQHKTLIKSLKRLGYGDNVIQDEIQAYMSTSFKKELVDELKIDYDKTLPIIKKYRSTFKKFYKQ